MPPLPLLFFGGGELLVFPLNLLSDETCDQAVGEQAGRRRKGNHDLGPKRRAGIPFRHYVDLTWFVHPDYRSIQFLTRGTTPAWTGTTDRQSQALGEGPRTEWSCSPDPGSIVTECSHSSLGLQECAG